MKPAPSCESAIVAVVLRVQLMQYVCWFTQLVCFLALVSLVPRHTPQIQHKTHTHNHTIGCLRCLALTLAVCTLRTLGTT